MTDSQRADFEAAMDGLRFDRADDGTYTSSVTRVALEAYQAGRAALLAERDALRDALQGLLDALPSATAHPAIQAARAALAQGEV